MRFSDGVLDVIGNREDPAATDGGLYAPTQRAPETLHRRPSGAAITPEFRGARRPLVPALAQQR